ncbi:hypothetical protein TWF506_004449 [Arthrobotrys conoides]|uniref:BTB domain-containing protein n=1 Tax=Arthrobotrys conoides TaxID=74498 RepID=A0AAN8NK27_9PEZI
MASLSREITLEPEKAFGTFTKSVERAFDDYYDADTPYFRTTVLNLWQQFISQELADVLIKVISPSGVVYSLAAHRVILACMTALKDKINSRDDTIELHGIDPRCFFHLVAFAYTSVADTLSFGHVVLPEVDDTSRHSLVPTEFYEMQKIQRASGNSDTTDNLEDSCAYQTSGSSGPPIVSLEEKLFQVNLCITAKKLGLKDISRILEPRWTLTGNLEFCKCSGSYSCPFLVENFDKDTWLEYFRLVYTNFTKDEFPYRELINSTMLLLQTDQNIPEALTMVLKEVPQFAQELAAQAQQPSEAWDEEYYQQLKRQQEMKAGLLMKLAHLTS